MQARNYGRVMPEYWTGRTGQRIQAHGPEAVVVGAYLMSSPHSTMLGLYHLPLLYIAEETGLGFEGASKGLRNFVPAHHAARIRHTRRKPCPVDNSGRLCEIGAIYCIASRRRCNRRFKRVFFHQGFPFKLTRAAHKMSGLRGA